MSSKTFLKAFLAFVAMLWLSGNPARVLAQIQARPEAPPFDAARITMQPPPPEGVAIRAGRMFDPKTGTNLTNQVIVIRGDRITDVGPADRVKIPAGARVIDLSSATVLPGLDRKTGTNLTNQVIVIRGDRITDVDPADRVKIPAGARVIDLSTATVLPGLLLRHVHSTERPEPNEARSLLGAQHYALADMYAGFTTLQDLNSPYTYATVELRDATNKGMIVGPRMQVTGPAINPRGATAYAAPSEITPFGMTSATQSWQNSENVNSPWLARASVREHSHYGTDWIKIYETEDY